MSSDKQFWHDYIDAYEDYVFKNITGKSLILEYGVLKGESIEFLSKRFPDAHIIGIDIDLSNRDILPSLEKVTYVQLDQRNKHNVRSLLANYGAFDLIIDDGSHRPEDQAVCMLTSLPFIKTGGYYIVEDIHTNDINEPNPLRTLLAIQHMKKSGTLNSATRESLAPLVSEKYFSFYDIITLCNNITDLKLVRRSCLPMKCWNCQGTKFDYINLKCECTQPLFSHWDSMSFMIRKA